MAATKSMLLMLMIASLASGAMAALLALFVGGSTMLYISVPGFMVGAFFALKYAMFNRSKAKQEEHKRSRNRHKH